MPLDSFVSVEGAVYSLYTSLSLPGYYEICKDSEPVYTYLTEKQGHDYMESLRILYL